MTVSQATHTVPTLGYLVWERRRKLKPEYHGLRGDQIRDLRMAGEDVAHEVRIPRVAYLADTSPEGLDNCPDLYRAQLLIVEMTFVAPSHRKDKIHKHGHMHLDDFVERADRFRNELIICAHFSTRYHPQEVRRYIEGKLPPPLRERVKLWL